MSGGPSDRAELSVPPCSSNQSAPGEAACAQRVEVLLRSFSSALALAVLLALIAALVLLSLATFRCHKSRLKKRKMLRAQEEYERDQRSPPALNAARGTVKPCMVVRAAPKRCETNPPESTVLPVRCGAGQPAPAASS